MYMHICIHAFSDLDAAAQAVFFQWARGDVGLPPPPRAPNQKERKKIQKNCSNWKQYQTVLKIIAQT